MEIRACEYCYYARPCMQDDLVVCDYLDDIIKNKEATFLTKEDEKVVKYFVDLTNFQGDVFKAYRVPTKENEDPTLAICVVKTGHCGKFQKKL